MKSATVEGINSEHMKKNGYFGLHIRGIKEGLRLVWMKYY